MGSERTDLQAGITASAASKPLGVHFTTACRWCARLGVPMVRGQGRGGYQYYVRPETMKKLEYWIKRVR